ncbi:MULTISPECIES: hypothetical protein [Streptomyces]|uniref:HEAT repeat-containing protein n=1 Tax=Streptomyces lonegramiae TaxID=3075524 RepID=A0ABU2XFA5_9ACTN|nr:hypothetical protein [Streptomyces sp. DSM 41529]MDT0544576.1 hypothetical protein [Streptomyces sp. DSM 41529]
MTSRTPRDSRLRLVRQRPMATARRAVPNRGSRPAPRPPEGTPPPTELARQARTGLAGAVLISRWAASRHGAPGVLSAEAVAEAAAALGVPPEQVRADWDRARLVGLIELHGGIARPGWRLRAWDSDDSAVLRGWVALLDAWSLARPAPLTAEPTAVAEVVEALPQLLSLLQLSAGPVQVATLLDMLRQRVAELRTERCEVPYGPAPAPGPDDAPPASGPEDTAFATAPGAPDLETLLDWALDALASVGALEVLDGPQEAADEAVRRDGADEREAVLSALGNWAVWLKLEQICVAAQSPAGNIEQPAADMLRGCAGLTPGPARAEYRAWLAARPVGSAVTELIEAARGDDALLRGLAFEALRVVGAPAEPTVRAVVDESALRPYALLWLAEHEGADPEDAMDVLTREEATWLWVDTAAAVADHGESPMLVRHLESAVQGTVPALLDEVRAVGHPRTVHVLVALAAAHPDPALAKAVRRAAFQVHTGGA